LNPAGSIHSTTSLPRSAIPAPSNMHARAPSTTRKRHDRPCPPCPPHRPAMRFPCWRIIRWTGAP